MKSRTLLSLLAISSLPLATATTYSVLHRVSSFSTSPEWTVRGTIDLLDNATTSYTDVLASEEVKLLHEQAASPQGGELFYQVALSPAADEGKVEEQGLWTSVRLCHLRQSHPDLPTIDDELSLTLRKQQVVGLHYRVLDIALDSSSCPTPSAHKYNQYKEEQRKQRQRQLSRRSRSPKSTPPPAPSSDAEHLRFATTLHVTSSAPPTAGKPTLKQAAPTNEDGTIQVPPPEKTFVQKYWYYAIPVVLLLIMPDGQDEKAGGAEGHASSEHRGTGMGAKRLN
ncbi:hypothetical protein EX895_004349 [Sporisorium graminicola]|uniref:ER membrane protein complex subunit 10 n=1 Tax=Sporisorium graminicola TaxID=280036 RepID=A0A4V6EV90_9BASI|nr:hypothetical protein EX895_004349 [Sporisorium graminicola]TKY86709.1 hypothetical protein EX895_004349 [Sporisorium graminicola]